MPWPRATVTLARFHVQLEVHGICGVARLAHELTALDEQADNQPADDADERADDARQEFSQLHQ
jgi:hypothetical protein